MKVKWIYVCNILSYYKFLFLFFILFNFQLHLRRSWSCWSSLKDFANPVPNSYFENYVRRPQPNSLKTCLQLVLHWLASALQISSLSTTGSSIIDQDLNHCLIWSRSTMLAPLASGPIFSSPFDQWMFLDWENIGVCDNYFSVWQLLLWWWLYLGALIWTIWVIFKFWFVLGSTIIIVFRCLLNKILL